MKRKLKNLKHWLLMLVAVFLLLPLGSVKASNERPDIYEGNFWFNNLRNNTNVYWSYYPSAKNMNTRRGVRFSDLEDAEWKLDAGWKCIDSKVTSSDPSVATIKDLMASGIEESGYSITTKKPGRTKITITDKFKKGKQTKTFTKTFWLNSVKYENPFKGIRLDDKSYMSQYNKYCGHGNFSYGHALTVIRAKGSTVFRYSLKPNWIIQAVNVKSGKEKAVKMSTIKSGTRLKSGDGSRITLYLKNTKTNIKESVTIYLNKSNSIR